MGKTYCTNLKTREQSETIWKEKGWSSANYNLIEGVTKNTEGQPVYEMTGNFTKSLKLLKIGESEH